MMTSWLQVDTKRDDEPLTDVLSVPFQIWFSSQANEVIYVQEVPDASCVVLEKTHGELRSLCEIVLFECVSYCQLEGLSGVAGAVPAPPESQALRWVESKFSWCLDVDGVSQHLAMWYALDMISSCRTMPGIGVAGLHMSRNTKSGGVELVVADADLARCAWRFLHNKSASVLKSR